MNHLTIRYDLPVGFDPATIVHYPLVGIMEWRDVFAERDQWKALAKDAVALLIFTPGLNAAAGLHADAIIKRMEKLL